MPSSGRSSRQAVNNGIEVVGLEDRFDGLIEPNRSRVMTAKDVTGILRRGGTILGTVNRGDPFAHPVETSEGKHDYSTRVVEMFHRMGLDALVVLGGDGTFAIAHKFSRMGIPLIGVPKTIDNDIVKTRTRSGSTRPSRSPPTPSTGSTRPLRRTAESWWSS